MHHAPCRAGNSIRPSHGSGARLWRFRAGLYTCGNSSRLPPPHPGAGAPTISTDLRTVPSDSGSESSSLRVAVLSCGDLGARVADELVDLREVAEVLLLTAPWRRNGRSPVARLLRSLRYDGLFDTLASLFARVRGTLAVKQPSSSTTEAASVASPASSRVDHHHVEAFEGRASLRLLDDFDPDLAVVAGTYILPESVYDLPRRGSLNLHSGKAPEYRGSAPAFWELYHGEDSVGVTVHEVTAELDAGRILFQESVPLDPAPAGDPVAYIDRYRSEVLEPAGVHLLARAVRALAREGVEPRPQDEGRARVFRSPTRWDVWKLRWRVLVRRVKRGVADVLGRVAFASGIHRRFLGERAVIVLFHRVSHEAEGNPLACAPEVFARYCDFFGRYFRVVGLSELLARLRSGEPVEGCLTITFDDGYRDNYRLARPILEFHDHPACFFLATGYVGSTRVPSWDEIRGERPAWMSWEEVSDLIDRGFEIGAHTRNHVDLGQADCETAYREITASRRDIANRTGVDPAFFSFPFGRETNITDANRERVREADFICCLSACGGTVAPETDPFHLPRIPVSDWFSSPFHLGWRILRDRL